MNRSIYLLIMLFTFLSSNQALTSSPEDNGEAFSSFQLHPDLSVKLCVLNVAPISNPVENDTQKELMTTVVPSTALPDQTIAQDNEEKSRDNDVARSKLFDPSLVSRISENGKQQHLKLFVNAATDALIIKAGILQREAPQIVTWEDVKGWSKKFYQTRDKCYITDNSNLQIKVSSLGFLSYCALFNITFDNSPKIDLLRIYQELYNSGNKNPTFKELCDAVIEYKKELRINNLCLHAQLGRTNEKENRPQEAIRAVHNFLTFNGLDSDLYLVKGPFFSPDVFGTKLDNTPRNIYYASVKLWLNDALGEERENYILQLFDEFQSSRLSGVRDLTSIMKFMEAKLDRKLYTTEEIEMNEQLAQDVQGSLEARRSILADDVFTELAGNSESRHFVAAVIEAKIRVDSTLKKISWKDLEQDVKSLKDLLNEPLCVNTSTHFKMPVTSFNVFVCSAYKQMTEKSLWQQTLLERMTVICTYLYQKGIKNPSFEDLRTRFDGFLNDQEVLAVRAAMIKD